MTEYVLSERVKRAMQEAKDMPEDIDAPEPIDPNKRVNVKMNNGKIRIVKYSDAQIYEQRGIGKIV